MAHMMKHAKDSCGHMFAHYDRKEDAIAREELIIEERNAKLKKLKNELEEMLIEKENIFSQEFLKIMSKSKFSNDEEKIKFIERINLDAIEEQKKMSGNTHQAVPEISFSDRE